VAGNRAQDGRNLSLVGRLSCICFQAPAAIKKGHPALHYTSFGKTDLRPSRIGFGCSQIASISTAHPRSEVRATLLEAVDRGINFFDTADVYGQGDSERMLGKLFRGNRDRLIYCTKAGLTLGLSQNIIRLVKPVANPLMRHWKHGRKKSLKTRRNIESKCFDPAYLKKRIEGSLRRLNTDYLDIVLLHSPGTEVIADGLVFEMLNSLQEKGLIRHYGVSCDTVTSALQCSHNKDIACIQFPGNVAQHQALDRALPLMQEKRIGVILREPFGGGNVFSYPPLLELAQNRPDLSPARIALQYLLQRDDSGVILGGMTCRRHLRENLDVLSGEPLTARDIDVLQRTTDQSVQSYD